MLTTETIVTIALILLVVFVFVKVTNKIFKLVLTIAAIAFLVVYFIPNFIL